MDVAKLVLEYIRALAWPVVIVGIVWMLRRQLRELAANLAERAKHLKSITTLGSTVAFEEAADRTERFNDLAVDKLNEDGELVARPGHDGGLGRYAREKGEAAPASTGPTAKEDEDQRYVSKMAHPSRWQQVSDLAARLERTSALPRMDPLVDLYLRPSPVAAVDAYNSLSEYVMAVAELMGAEPKTVRVPSAALYAVGRRWGSGRWLYLAESMRELTRMLELIEDSNLSEEMRHKLLARYLDVVEDTGAAVARVFEPVAELALRRGTGPPR